MPDIYTTAQQHRQHLLDREHDAADRMTRAWAASYRKIEKDLARLVGEVEKMREQGQEVGIARLLRMERYRSLLAQIETQIAKFAKTEEGAVRESLSSAYAQATSDAAGQIATIRTDFDRLPVRAVESAAGLLADNSPVADLFRSLSVEGSERARNALLTGLAAGRGTRATAPLLRDALGVPLHRALTISRTETLRAYREGSLDAYRASGVVEKWRWLSSKSARTCPACLYLDGTLHDLSEPMAAHPNCYPAGVTVSAPGVLGATARWYDGDMVHVRTASGNEFSVTPNHPILTATGWLAAGLIHVGDNLVSCADPERAVASVYPNDHQVPALIEEVAGAFGRSRGVVAETVEVAPEDFHGDGGHGEVAVVWSDGLLGHGHDALLREPFAQLGFVGRDVRDVRLAGGGAQALLLEGVDPPARGLVRRPGVPSVLLGGPCRHHQAIGDANVAPLDALGAQPRRDRGSGHAEFAGQGVLALSSGVTGGDLVVGEAHVVAPRSRAVGGGERLPFGGAADRHSPSLQQIAESLGRDVCADREGITSLAADIAFDQVVEVGVRQYSGHVYNLQTATGWYVANGVVTHNCRCTSTPWFEGLPERETGAEWLERQPPETQDAVLGKSGGAQYRSGGVILADFTAKKHHHRFGTSLTRTSVEAALDSAARRGGGSTSTQ